MGKLLKSVQSMFIVAVKSKYIPACQLGRYLFLISTMHHALQKHLSHSLRCYSQMVDILNFIFPRNNGKVLMSSGSACVTAALDVHVRVYLRSLINANISLLYKSNWNIAAQLLNFVNYWAWALKVNTCQCHHFYWQDLLLEVICWNCWRLWEDVCVPVKPTAEIMHLHVGFTYIVYCRCFANIFINFFSF